MLSETLNLVVETIKEVYMKDEWYQRRAKKRYNSQVKPRNFQASDLVWRKCEEALKDAKKGKLSRRTCYIRVFEVLRNRAYRLEHTRHNQHLKKNQKTSSKPFSSSQSKYQHNPCQRESEKDSKFSLPRDTHMGDHP